MRYKFLQLNMMMVKTLKGLPKADIVLLGISETSKTCRLFTHKSYKVMELQVYQK